MKRSEIIKKFNPLLSENDLEIVENYGILSKKVETHSQKIQKIEQLISRESNNLKQKIIETGVLISTSLFGSRKFINESYAFQIPIRKEFFEDIGENIIRDSILTIGASTNTSSNKQPLSVVNMSTRKQTSFKFVDKILHIEENLYYNYQEIEIKIPSYLVSGVVYLEFDSYHNISILDKYGREVSPKEIRNSIEHPLSVETGSIILRFNNNGKKRLTIKEFFITTESYNKETTFTTKSVEINKMLSQIALSTCDNYSSENIDIDYEISVNNKSYKKIRPLNEQKNLDIYSIISTDPDMEEILLDDYVEDGFNLDSLVSQDFDLKQAFEYKLGEDFGILDTSDIFYVYVENSQNLNISKDMEVYIDDEKINTEEDVVFELTKGTHKFKTNLESWYQKTNLLKEEILSVDDDKITVRGEEGDIRTFIATDSLFYQLYKNSIYSSKIEASVAFKNNKMIIESSSKEKIYILVKDRYNMVETVKLRIKLKTLNSKTPPFITSLIIRGI